MRATLVLLPLLLLAACKQDPYERDHTWSLPPAGLGANDANLRAMLVNPNDLAEGSGDDSSTGPLSVRPVDLLMAGRRLPLPSVNASTIGVGRTGAGAGAGAGTGGGGGAPAQQ